jgi:hypothetical protein
VKYRLLTLVAVGAGCWLSCAQAVDKNKPYVRVCFAVMNSANGEEVAFRATSTPGKGKKIVAHIDVTAKCEAVVAAALIDYTHTPGEVGLAATRLDSCQNYPSFYAPAKSITDGGSEGCP